MSATRAETTGVAPSVMRLEQRARSLGAANAFDYAAQFLLPLVLVRCLDTPEFAQYRLLWLAAGTVLACVTLAMPASLYYFLPRSDDTQRRLYVNQTLLYLAAAGLVSAWAVSPWNPWLPDQMNTLAGYGAVVPAFVLLWVIASLLDVLPTVDERVAWQARAIVGLATLRSAALSLAAILTRDLGPVLLVMLGFVAFKVVLLLRYVAVQHGLRAPLLRWRRLRDQLRYAAPFGASGMLYELRVQADQWVAAALFSLATFASFSIAAVLGSLLNLCRQSVNNAFLPSMSRLQASGDVAGLLALNSRANVLVGTFVFPLLAFVFAFTEDIVTVVYTAAYLDAVPVFRTFVFGLAALVVELATITLLLRQGLFVARLNAILLVLSVALSAYAALRLGIAGAALGSVCAIYVDRLVTLRRIARLTGRPLRRLQDWNALARLILLSALAGAFAWGTVEYVFGLDTAFARVAAGALLLALAYVSLYLSLGGAGADRAQHAAGGAVGRPRVVFVTASLAPGGAERHAVALMNRLAQRGYACHGVCVRAAQPSLAARLRLDEHGSVRCLRARRYFDLRALAAFAAHLRDIQPAAIVAANPYALMYASLARRLARARAPLLVTFHSTWLRGIKERLQMLAYRPFFWSAHCLVFVCANQRRHWLRRGLFARRIEVIHNGVDTDEYRDRYGEDERARLRAQFGCGEHDYLIGISAWLRPEKNHLQLIEALAALRARGLAARVLMIGDGPARRAVLARARARGVENEVAITGFQPDVRACIAACDVMVLCSVAETFSLASLEAMALGRAVVHSEVGGAAEMVFPGRNGFLFPVGDTAALVEKLAQLADRALARRMGEQARAVVEALFSETRMVDRYAQLLADLGARRLSAGTATLPGVRSG